MDEVTVNTQELLDILKKNMEGHKEVYETAFKVFRQDAIDAMQAAIDAAKQGKKFSIRFDMPVPHDHTEDYKRAIGMLEMTLRAGVKTIPLMEHNYTRYVMDKWEWTDSFKLSSSAYLAKVGQ